MHFALEDHAQAFNLAYFIYLFYLVIEGIIKGSGF